jgi:DNA replication protein DnaC
MTTTENHEALLQLKLPGMANCYDGILQLPINNQPEGHELLSHLVDAEKQHRQLNKTEHLLKFAKLRYNATIDQIECSAARNLTKQQLVSLADCSFIEKSQNILITGATGCGKSYLACAIGNRACIKGYKTLYLNMNRFAEKIMLSKLDGSFLKMLSQIEKIKLVILDDFGLQPLNQNIKLALLQILEDRYQLKSIVIASQLPVNSWYEHLNEPTLADAIMDRLTANTHRIELKGESLRRKKGHGKL